MQGPLAKLCPACSPLPLQQLQQPQGAAALLLLYCPRDKPACRDSRERPVLVEEAGAEEVATDANKEGPVEASTEVLLVLEAVVAAVDVTAETKSTLSSHPLHNNPAGRVTQTAQPHQGLEDVSISTSFSSYSPCLSQGAL